MQVRFQRDKLLQAFQIAASVVPTRTPKPILQNVKLTVKDGKAVLNATDAEIAIRIEVAEPEIIVPGCVLLSVNRFGAILRESSDEQLTIKDNGTQLEVQGARSHFRLPSENPDEFAQPISFSEEAFFEIPSRVLGELIRRTVFAIDTDNSRYALGGVLFEFTADKLTTVGTDGKRLASMEAPLKAVGGIQPPSQNVIIPSRATNLLERLLSENDAPVALVPRENNLLVRTEKAIISTQLLEGRYPRWRDIMEHRPVGEDIGLTVGPLHVAVRQAAIITDNDTRALGFQFENGNLILEGSVAQLGESRVELPVSYSGPTINVDLDNRFVCDFLRVLDPQRGIVLNAKDQDSATEFRTDDGYRYIVMPMARDRPRHQPETVAAVN